MKRTKNRLNPVAIHQYRVVVLIAVRHHQVTEKAGKPWYLLL
jgi:hypothetical protein